MGKRLSKQVTLQIPSLRRSSGDLSIQEKKCTRHSQRMMIRRQMSWQKGHRQKEKWLEGQRISVQRPPAKKRFSDIFQTMDSLSRQIICWWQENCCGHLQNCSRVSGVLKEELRQLAKRRRIMQTRQPGSHQMKLVQTGSV